MALKVKTLFRLPAWAINFGSFDPTSIGAVGGSLLLATYSAYTWTGRPLVATPAAGFYPLSQTVLFGNTLQVGRQARFPRAVNFVGPWANFAPVSSPPWTDIVAFCAPHGIDVVFLNAGGSGWLTHALLPDGYTAVTQVDGVVRAQKTTFADRWVSGDELHIVYADDYPYDSLISPYQYFYAEKIGGVVTAGTNAISHDQANLEGAVAAFHRSRWVYWDLPLDGSADAAAASVIYAAAVSGLTGVDAAYNLAGDLSTSPFAAVAATFIPEIKAFFGL